LTDASAGVRCAACGGAGLVPHFRVAGSAGESGLIPTTDRYGVALADFVRCTECGHAQLESMPGAAVLDESYEEAASEDYEAEVAGQRATARRELERIERHARPGRLADLGSWLGYLVEEAGARGWSAVGVEPSSWASERARRRGLEVVNAPMLEADLPAGAFDAVTLGDVIEHLPEPGVALSHIHALLAPGGVLWMATPDAGSRAARLLGRRWWSVIPTHVHLFTRSSIRRLLERSGFDVLEIATSPKVFSVRYYLERLGGYWPPLARVAVRVAELLRVADRQVAPDFRDRMAVVARVRSGP
jgi:SAM-dependent methyltransferase